MRRVVLYTGKVHFDLVMEREKRLGDRIGEVALVRLEQVYPWPEAELRELLDRYGDTQDVVWCQEEPQNMGPWTFVWPRIQSILGDRRRLRYSGREEAASPATGSPRTHKAQLERFLEDALGGL